jgi:hypothetical protein
VLDHIAQKLAEDPDLKRWKARNEGRRRGKKGDGPASHEAETAPASAGASADPFREEAVEALADPDMRARAAAGENAARTSHPMVKGTFGDR